ncbi:MAG: hypothetical protein GWN84_11160 [Gammaproteobacteria bacterium]|nr:hypothetical protein [Gammaproteobacteria bacterium]NIR83423.1 hypothetical protein [Gammaproteobacteria bacterium]NIR91345.1 hypothetical protein [Gammaproteobacteria bacterium]NIU04585.1 hypothetical protein [Gammaproteobacteria bacterium]NIV51627.1 hypothetical protein [Gammaproteobacteria bacterium]
MDIWSSLLRGVVAGARGGISTTRLFVVASGVLVAAAGTGFLFAALYLFLLEEVGPPLAALITGLVVLAIAAVLLVSARPQQRTARRPRPQANPEEALLETVEAVRREIAAHPIDSVTAAVIVGAVLGASPGARRALKDLLR